MRLLVALLLVVTIALQRMPAHATSSTTLRVFPTTAAPGDPLTVAVDHLPLAPGHAAADAFCPYLVGAGPYALARRALPGTFAPDYPRRVVTQPDPSLTPGGVETSGVGSYVLPTNLPAGQYTIYLALCEKGAVPTILAPDFAEARITVSETSAVIVPAAHVERSIPAGHRVRVSLQGLNVNGDTCLFFTSVDRLTPGTGWTGQPIRPGARSLSLPVPAGTPSGRYQLFVTSRTPDGPCPASRLVAAHLLASTSILVTGKPIAALDVNANGTRMRTGEAIRIEIHLARGVAPAPLCLSTLRSGERPKHLETIPAKRFTRGHSWTAWPLGAPGTVTVIASLGRCGPPQAYSTVIVGVQ